MLTNELVPCYANTLFLRGEDYPASDGPLVRMQILTQIYDLIADLKNPELIPYLGALTLHSLEQYSVTKNHWDEPNAMICRVIPGHTAENHSMVHEIFNAWRECCPRGYVLLPKQLHSAAIKVQTQSWESEIENFARTPFTQKHIEVAAL